MTSPLDRMAQRAEADPFFLASLLALYAGSEQLDDAGLAAALGCPVETLTDVRLCRAPRPQEMPRADAHPRPPPHPRAPVGLRPVQPVAFEVVEPGGGILELIHAAMTPAGSRGSGGWDGISAGGSTFLRSRYSFWP